jgi:hypothetical protein
VEPQRGLVGDLLGGELAGGEFRLPFLRSCLVGNLDGV